MSAWATPANRSAATTLASCASAASSAWLAVRDCAWTPNEKCARSGTVATVPDRAHFSFGVQAQSRTASQALEAADAQLARVVAALRLAGVAQADIQTEQISLSPRTSEDGVQVVGYTAVS